MDKVVHFEVPFDDGERARNFYREAFGWRLGYLPELDYTSAVTTATDNQGRPVEPGAINGGMVPRDERTPAPVITVDVDHIDEALAQIEARGGTTVTPRTEIPGMGAFAYFTDPEGNVLGLWETTT